MQTSFATRFKRRETQGPTKKGLAPTKTKWWRRETIYSGTALKGREDLITPSHQGPGPVLCTLLIEPSQPSQAIAHMIIRAVLQVQQLRHRLADAKVTQQMIRRTRTQTQILTPPSPVLAQQHTAPFSGKNVKARMDPPVSNVVTMSTLGAALALSMGFVL